MIIKNGNFFGKLSLQELNDFETENKIKLPYDYKNFLLENNGGVPVNQINQFPNTRVEYLFGMHYGDYYASLYKHISMFHGSFPIGSDSFGNLFLMSVHPDSYGQLYFWNHEGESKKEDGNYIANILFIANSFGEFLEKLI